MYLLWKRTKTGNLLLGKEGLKNFIAGMLPSGYECEDVGLSSDTDEVLTTLTLPDIHSTLEVDLIEEKISKIFEPTGLRPKISWGQRSSRINPFLQFIKGSRPILTGVVVAGLVALYHLGFSGVLSVFASGLVAASLVYLLLCPDGKRTLKSLKERYWR